MRVFYFGGVVQGREVGGTDLYGTVLTPREVRWVGRLGQAGGIEPFVFDEGPARGEP